MTDIKRRSCRDQDERTGRKLEVSETRMKGHAETGENCGDQDERTGRKLEVSEKRMKGHEETGENCGDQDERTGRKLEVPETRMKGQAKREMFAKTRTKEQAESRRFRRL
jgi:hypothetical protein